MKWIFGFWFAAVVATNCVSGGDETAKPIDDVTAYCKTAGSVDLPDETWAGPTVPAALATSASGKFGEEPATNNEIRWRCMDGQPVWCLAWGTTWCGKSDSSLTPSPASVSYCVQHPNEAGIPRAATGNATVRSWHCQDGTPVASSGTAPLDSQGYHCGVWYLADASAAVPCS